MQTIGWLLGLKDIASIDKIEAAFAAPWASEGAFWVFFGAIFLIALSLFFYAKLQGDRSLATRLVLGGCRGFLLAMLFLTLADPVLRISVVKTQRPRLYFIFDGSESMAIEDQWTPAQHKKLAAAVGLEADDDAPRLTRMQYLQAWLKNSPDNLLQKLQEDKQYEIEVFLFDGDATSQIRKISASNTDDETYLPRRLADQLTTKGQVTSISNVFSDVRSQFGSANLAGVVMFSDFAHNAGAAPLGGDEPTSAAKIGKPIYTVGIGAVEAVDMAVSLQADPKMKKAERTTLYVKLQQTGLQNQSVDVLVMAQRQSGDSQNFVVGEKTVSLNNAVEVVSFPFTPPESGRFQFTASVKPIEGEAVEQNNRASRQVNIIDDYLRLMYTAYEPTWEWRFIKEVFHRDKLVGIDGFRTYLSSSDPRVRRANVLFLPSLTPKRSEFFANDVIFLGDMPRDSLSPRFCEMLKEYVGRLGGGLVVIAGPRFGPREINETELADMLPVIIDPNMRMRESEFQMKRTPHAVRYPFMQLADEEDENNKAWNNLGKLPWYQPAAALHEQAFALAEHPTDTCQDGRTPQPLIAIRPYGKGEVAYIAFNEMWRLRRKYGERYYRRFWSQLIYRLGMSHALGDDKRFAPMTDRRQYKVDDIVSLAIEAYDENYEPLAAEDLPNRSFEVELTLPSQDAAEPQKRSLKAPLLRRGVFETRFPVYVPGQYSIRLQDPITKKDTELRFEVLGLSAERRSAVRDLQLQQDLANATNGRSYDLTTVSQLADDLQFEPTRETLTHNQALWTTPLWFILLVVLMLGEWLTRKLIHLS